MKKRSDSSHVMTKLTQAAVKKIEPPLPLDKSETPFFNAIMQTRAEWTSADLLMACNLARTFSMIEENQRLLDTEGLVIDGAYGKAVNPRHKIVETLIRRSLAMSRLLNVHAAATIGRARDQVNKNRAYREAADALEDDDDDLIAKPH